MLKTSGARESSRIQQRWGEEIGSSCEPPAAGRPAKHLGAKVCSTKRVLLELFVFFVLLLWVVLIALNLASRMEPCQLTRQTVRGDLGNRFIHLKSWNGAAFWYVKSDGVLAVSRTATGVNASFHVEWQDKEWFCLRSLNDLRVVEVMPSDAAQPWVLRTVHLGCRLPAQLFAYRGHSIFSKGAGSYVNMRELQHLRAHGDTLPWSPLSRETRQTRVAVDEASGAAKDPAGFERRLLRVLSSLEEGARGQVDSK